MHDPSPAIGFRRNMPRHRLIHPDLGGAVLAVLAGAGFALAVTWGTFWIETAIGGGWVW